MKKTALLMTMLFSICMIGMAQKPQQQMITVDKQTLPGFTITFTDLDAKSVATAVDNRFQKQGGLKAGKFKGYTLYASQQFPEFGALQYDIYTKVANEGKKGSIVSTFYLVVTKGNMNAITASSDPQIVENIKKFMEEFPDYARASSAQNMIIQLNSELSKQQKEQQKMEGNMKKLQDNVSSIQKEMDENQQKINSLKSAIDQNQNLLNRFQK